MRTKPCSALPSANGAALGTVGAGEEKKSGLVFVFAADVLLLPKAFDLGHLIYTSSIVHEPPFAEFKSKVSDMCIQILCVNSCTYMVYGKRIYSV